MAGQAHRGSRARARSCHRDSSSARRVPASAVGAGVAATSPASTPTTTHPSVATQQIYRGLIRTGLTLAEAANLTAFLCGIPLNDVQWNLKQVNRLLFIRELHRTGRLSDGIAPAVN